jgi:hypothetical protein
MKIVCITHTYLFCRLIASIAVDRAQNACTLRGLFLYTPHNRAACVNAAGVRGISVNRGFRRNA